MAKREQNSFSQMRIWLYFVAFLVFCAVIVGGATRLTNSGLSITEWRPLLGVIPPLNEAEWLGAFQKYQLIPQFKVLNSQMTLEQFKYIYWWEWAHRFLTRFIGVAFALPFLYFAIARKLDAKLFLQLLVLLLLGAAQGALGWYMVSSGLIDRVDVSQYRLAAHLTLAAFIFAAILWVASGVGKRRESPQDFNDWFALLLVVLVLFQIAAGGFVAGLDAGQGYQTWPKMDGKWIPDGLLSMQPVWKNFFENALTVQFTHRMTAYVLLLASLNHAWRCFSLPSMVLVYVVFSQACVGILTLIMHVPFSAALAHQAGAIIVLAFAVWNLHSRLVTRLPALGPR